MGANKLLLELGPEPVVRRAARQALEAGLSPVIVVLGFEATRVAAALEGLRVETVVNRDAAQGMGTSIRTGIARVPDDCVAAVVMLADMPLVAPGMLARMVGRFRASGAPLVVSVYGEVPAPPTLYARPLFPELGEVEGEAGGQPVVRAHRDQAMVLRWPAALLADLDRPEDVERTRVLLLESGPSSAE